MDGSRQRRDCKSKSRFHPGSPPAGSAGGETRARSASDGMMAAPCGAARLRDNVQSSQGAACPEGKHTMARLRIFIAGGLDKPIHDRLVALQESLARSGSDVKWVERENLHVTLLFLGEVEDRDLPAVCRSVADCCGQHAPFALSIE